MEQALQHSNVQSIDDRLWNDVKHALDSIARHAEDILAQWVVVGQRLAELRQRNPGYRSNTFSAACREHGILLTPNQRSAAMWWAQLDDRQRDVLSEKNPDALSPKTLQDRCRETRPEWAKSRKSHTSPSGGSKGIRPRKAPSRSRRDMEREAHREDLKTRREQKAAAAAAAAANDRRPILKPGPYPVVMYGKQLWPVSDEERVTVGQYDYDQLVNATLFFIHQRDLVRMPAGDLAANLRLRTRFLRRFVDTRLVDAGAQEMRRFLEVLHLLCFLHEENPDGECRPPSDRALFEV